MKKFLLIALSIVSVHLCAQELPNELWHNGQIVLESGDTLKGKVKYSLENDIVQYQAKKGTIETVTAHRLSFFEIFDQTVSRNRVFHALPYDKTGEYKTLVIFEVLVKGNLTLLSREKIETVAPKGGLPGNSNKRLTYDNYILIENKTIVPLGTEKKEVIASMPGYRDRIKKYIKDNKLNMEKRSDLARVIALYNSLSN